MDWPQLHAWQYGEAGPMTTVNVSLPDEMKTFVEAQLASEGIASTSEEGSMGSFYFEEGSMGSFYFDKGINGVFLIYA